jgi:hypothetical protein
MLQRFAVVFREITEHTFIVEVEADTPVEAEIAIRGMNGLELDDVSRTNWSHDEFQETRVTFIESIRHDQG